MNGPDLAVPAPHIDPWCTQHVPTAARVARRHNSIRSRKKIEATASQTGQGSRYDSSKSRVRLLPMGPSNSRDHPKTPLLFLADLRQDLLSVLRRHRPDVSSISHARVRHNRSLREREQGVIDNPARLRDLSFLTGLEFRRITVYPSFLWSRRAAGRESGREAAKHELPTHLRALTAWVPE